MIEFFFDYGLFLAKLGTVAVAIVVVVGVIVALTKRGAHQEGLLVGHVNKRLEGVFMLSTSREIYVPQRLRR